jgi:uncharacterized Zn-binding protein involved in type VI secretion
MKRHHITLGARTTADGVVTSASSAFSINGARLALEGDEVSCHTCGGTGTIRCTGPRTPERYNGKLVALENDLCMCQCVTPPRLVPSQGFRYQALDDTAV